MVERSPLRIRRHSRDGVSGTAEVVAARTGHIKVPGADPGLFPVYSRSTCCRDSATHRPGTNNNSSPHLLQHCGQIEEIAVATGRVRNCLSFSLAE